MAFEISNGSSRVEVSTEDVRQEFNRPATCPHCAHVGPVIPDFGLRKLRGRIVRQSWCKRCR